jgi:3-oxoacyl-[acyl-carrier protein] reductase
MEIKDASALVTGAGRGIGRAIALALARAGLDTLVGEVEAVGARGLAFAGDVRERSVCDAAVRTAVERFGGLQILVNNAGVGAYSNVADTSDEDWDSVIGTNLTAVFRLTRAALPHLAHRGGHVFMISSLAGTNPIAGMAAYAASKAALDHFAASLMLEVRHKGVKVTTLAPGSVDTSFPGGPRSSDTSWMLSAEDVAQVLMDQLAQRSAAHTSRIEIRPARPQKR